MFIGRSDPIFFLKNVGFSPWGKQGNFPKLHFFMIFEHSMRAAL